MKYAFMIAFSFLLLCHLVAARQKVILLLADGLRWDRFEEDLPSLMRVEENGVRAEWMDGVFVTLSTPSMYSIATGLYPESHGAIHNLYFDPVTGERTYSYYSTLQKAEWFDTGVEPVWVTAILQGLTAATIMYPGGSVPIKGIIPNKTIASTAENIRNYQMKDRIDLTISWLQDDDVDLVLMYFDNPDAYLHLYGIGSVNGTAKLYEVDSQIGYLFDRLAETGLDQTTNVIIASDHGHVNVERNDYVILSDYVDIEADIDFLVADYGPIFQLVPKNTSDDKVYNALKDAHPALHVYKKEDIPERLHYRDNPRILPIIGFVDPGWHMHTRRALHPAADVSSDHGYDNEWKVMKSSFYAQGPHFKKNYLAPALESVDLYNLMCEILDIEPAPNNGSRDRYVTMLANPTTTASPWTTSSDSKPTMAPLVTALSFVVGVIFSSN
ncbi:ectonucleotide pyrophosphatase/phosphodiesterase family member 7-like [Lytechinus variegatus]|uniref:ectonucleotide pyrophosphatase/phosphodiesterase family member 7-like n=1 Tax=Lytechinus variegatus TaxID=7654 RepID=UPI001BB1F1A6|nr:ectonucleotide pyrophosphatase/phosphodiesterase family member 7-like [Lytechinus variegatus]